MIRKNLKKKKLFNVFKKELYICKWRFSKQNKRDKEKKKKPGENRRDLKFSRSASSGVIKY